MSAVLLKNLTLEIRGIDNIRIDDSDPANASSSEIHRHGRTKSPAPMQSTLAALSFLCPSAPNSGRRCGVNNAATRQWEKESVSGDAAAIVGEERAL